MSIIGIDIGSSSVKAVAYNTEGLPLAEGRSETPSIHAADGEWEQNPESTWQCTCDAIRQITQNDNMRKDPPVAIAVSASARENYPADEHGNSLANTKMAADIRGAEFEAVEEGAVLPEQWELDCGHLRERMDPMNRFRWWKKYYPEIIDKAKYYLDWHSIVTYKLCGRNVTIPNLVSRWAAFDLKSSSWNREILEKFEFPERLLPELMPSCKPIDVIDRKIAEDLGLPPGVLLATGGMDASCATLGIGVAKEGMINLISGSYENMIIPTTMLPTPELLLNGMSIMTHLGNIKHCAFIISPTGNALLNWARATVNITYGEVERELKNTFTPSTVLAIPYVSGAFMYWKNRRDLRGAVLGATLATKPYEIIQAFMESIAYDHVNTLSMLKASDIATDWIRATGGGTRSAWWTQLKSDIIGLPIEVMLTDEPGTFGAALMAGVAAGIYDDLDAASIALNKVAKTYEPDFKRAELHKARMELYNKAVPSINENVFSSWV